VSAAVAVAVAVGFDAAFGEPPNALHPVAWMGSAIARGRAWALRGSRPSVQFVRGALVALVVPAMAALAGAAVASLVGHAGGHPVVAAVVTALALKPLFAIRALRDAAFDVRDALDAGDVYGARVALASLCSRDATDLDASALIAATIESVAENSSDSVVAPLLYFAGFGLPGAAFYRAVNTIDAMMGYHGKLEWAGKVGARLDDALNLVPARATALLLVAAGAATGADAPRGLATWWRDRARTESPNAGHPMAAMAGLLGVRLVKRGHYALGDATRPLSSADITRAWRIAWIASLAAAAMAALLAGVLGR
jgi:adenosylcobinamide-phosphate synthase